MGALKLPWKLSGPSEWPSIVDADEHGVVSEAWREDAEQIVRAVNNFDALVAALGMCVDVLDGIARRKHAGDVEPLLPLVEQYADSALAVLREIRGH